jgi:Zn-dependent protease with chaperone function
MGHFVEGHIWVHLASSVIGAGFFLWLASRLFPWLMQRNRGRISGMTDLAALPLFLLTVSLFLLAQAPVASLESRILERRADAFGLRVTGLSEATARLHVGFAERDYTDPDPPILLHLWFGTHPTVRERIAFALSYRP